FAPTSIPACSDRQIRRTSLPADRSDHISSLVPRGRACVRGLRFRLCVGSFRREGVDMVLRNGREFLSIPGPTVVPDSVLNAMHRPAIDIYAGELLDLTAGCLQELRKLFRTKGRTYIYAANGHGAWEAAVTNV